RQIIANDGAARRRFPASNRLSRAFLGTLRRMQAAGIAERQVLRWLRRVEVTVVFTASSTVAFVPRSDFG
ncbi:MAG TPA: hypothetical protein VHQ95_20575, partial [Pyrinomonadaceae bacterium]|nr:hypothetical protein [Pyrinomonadaceae bacterium]